jgi:hypothetical protein
MSRVIDLAAAAMSRTLNRFLDVVVHAVEGFIALYQKYKTGPVDLDHHSKWPHFLRLHGSITPELILPLLFTGMWASAITIFSELVFSGTLQLWSQSTSRLTSSSRHSVHAPYRTRSRHQSLPLLPLHDRLRALQ